MNREQTVLDLGTHRISAIIRTDDRRTAFEAIAAVVRGGFRVVEFTLTTPGALDLIREFSSDRDLVVGAGTVLTAAAAHQSVEAGARFLVSPIMDPEIIAEARKLDVASIPGTHTPTEMMAAVRAGADIVKLFPAPADIPRYLGQVRAPLPHLRIFPTAGVDEDNFIPILRAGAFGVGLVASLFPAAELKAGDFTAIEERARRVVARLAAEG
jgi:2-dehydro-3-deoxyphosphogluconate aldolase/(4S)-4-hydroxy-2-oxoglutarate aldolase